MRGFMGVLIEHKETPGFDNSGIENDISLSPIPQLSF
jgi:hypothetical protein